jgi:hypothetical protein
MEVSHKTGATRQVLGDVTHFFNPDAGAKNAALNAANTGRVLKNCF